ncbi:hypothetical protein [Streptomyces sp. or20]|uniref:hypothetical protein n=1 Tax=Streptomyces sp. or20 TaxID=1828016 RepID=UPI000BEF6215|nr:hypothetical protein [Streptomyces sp. or20]
MAIAKLTEKIIRTDTVTLELTMDEARALMSLTRRADSAEAGHGPARELLNVNGALRDAGVPSAPGDKGFRVSGTVMFSAYMPIHND